MELVDLVGARVVRVGDGRCGTYTRLVRAGCKGRRTAGDVARLVREVAEDAAAAGAAWVEPSEWITATQASRLQLENEQAVLEVVLDAAHRAERATGGGVGIMVASNRTPPPAEAVRLRALAQR